MKAMLEAGVHFGHQTKFWNPKMKPYIFGARNKIHIINLDKTVVLFDEAIKFVKQIVRNKGTILFVGTRSQAGEIIANEAKRANQPYVNHRWLGGMLTNFETVKKSIQKLEKKQQLLDKSGEAGLSKKELLDLTREISKLQSSIGGIVEMKELPAALFIIDTGCHDIAILEAQKLGIPVIGVVDTNNDPSRVDYVIPGNDDSAQAISLYTSAVADTIIKAKESIVTEIASHAKLEMVDDAATDAKPKTVRRVKKANSEDSSEEDIAAAKDVAVEENNSLSKAAKTAKTVKSEQSAEIAGTEVVTQAESESVEVLAD